ncbi:MAG: cyclic 2,3-diphosphoglycerate synthase [Thermoplasmatales archaeon]|nr:cyclic 2,3-diphosphoglycerate synthase [Candidatus Thermoplasmatota archaeon]MCL6002822.1 cyclic 2,3-diphosphoglycerate synthase [Candidatus Thermoplasmatota archaeon]MDA8054316.1 cyclic 2,3-diphosphoglycerate synthase [Thermoplasmatales archaeon]
MTQNVLIMGAAGRDFHNFNTYFRDNKEYNVVGFTATQIPNIEGRTYPKELAGKLYPKGIPIYPESDLTKLIKEKSVDLVVFSYSDVTHEYVMHKGSEVLAAGANYLLLGPKDTQVKSKKPLISICAVRTGSGKSQTTRRVEDILVGMGKKVVAIRHPMPYGNLLEQKVQRFATMEDLVKQKCTIEEREEYEPHIKRNVIIYAGVDYEAILRQAEKEGDIVLWDGGNNDFSFYQSDLQIVVADPHRAGHEVRYHPGEVNLRSADVIVINKEETASLENINIVRENIRKFNPDAVVVDGASPFFSADAEKVRGKKVLAIEDGPTLTHGEMSYGAAVLFSIKYGASELVDAKEYAKGTIKGVYEKYKQIHNYLPAMGYSPKQVKDLEATINSTPADVVVSGTPIDLTKVVKINKPLINVKYELQEIGKPDLTDILAKFVKSH